MTTVEEREAVRAILMTPQQEILLLRIRPPDLSDAFWITPGGGLEPGETVESGLRRELREELGLEQFAVGPLVWRQQHTFNWGDRRISQRERYHIVRVPKFEPHMSDEIEAKELEEFRWWPAHELSAARERLTPLALPDIVARYLRDGAPHPLVDVEVLVD